MFYFGKRSVILFFLLSSLAGATMQEVRFERVAKTEQWKGFRSEESGFSVELPKEPERLAESIAIPKTNLSIKYETYVSEPSDSVVYVTSVWHYPAQIDMSKPEASLQEGFSGMVSALPGAKVISSKVSDFKGFRSLDFLVKDENIYFQGKLILVHNTLYQVFAVYKEEQKEAMKADFSHFIDSFNLIKPEQHKVSLSTTKLNV